MAKMASPSFDSTKDGHMFLEVTVDSLGVSDVSPAKGLIFPLMAGLWGCGLSPVPGARPRWPPSAQGWAPVWASPCA